MEFLIGVLHLPAMCHLFLFEGAVFCFNMAKRSELVET